MLLNVHTTGVHSLAEHSFKLLAINQRVRSAATLNMHATSVTSCAVACAECNICDVFNVGEAVDNVRTCEAARFDETGVLVDGPSWKVFSGT